MKKYSLKLPDNRGITLVEAIVASLLMVIGALVLSTGFIASARMMSVSAADRNAAQNVASVMNGGLRNGTTDSGNTREITFKIDDFVFSADAFIEKYADTKKENIFFCRINNR